MERPAEWIRAERARLGLSTRDLARLAGLSYPTISRIENGHEQARWSTLEKIFEVLGTPWTSSPEEQRQICLADLSEAWTEDAMHDHHPDWVRLRGLVDQVRMRPTLVARVIMPEPSRSGSALVDVLLAAVAEKLADDAGISRPRWTKRRPALREQWSAASRPSKRAEAEATAPAQFVRRGLLIPASAIWRDREMIPA